MQSILPTEVVSHSKEFQAAKISPPVRAGFYSWGRASRFNFGGGPSKDDGGDGSGGTWINPNGDRSQDGGGWLNPVGPSLEPDGPLPDDFSFVASFLSTQEIWKGQEIFRKISLADEGVAGLAVPVEGLSLATFDLGVRKVETVEVKQVDDLTIIYPTIETRQEYLELGFPLIEVLSRGNAAPPDRPYPPMPPEIQAAPTLEKTYDWEPRDYSGESYALSQPDIPSTEAVVQLGAFRVPMRFTSGSEVMLMGFLWENNGGAQLAAAQFYFEEPYLGSFGLATRDEVRDFTNKYHGAQYWPWLDEPWYANKGIITADPPIHYNTDHYDGTSYGEALLNGLAANHKAEVMRAEGIYNIGDNQWQYWYLNLTNIYKDWVPENPGDPFPRFIKIRMKMHAPVVQNKKIGSGQLKYTVFQKPPLSPAFHNMWKRVNAGNYYVPNRLVAGEFTADEDMPASPAAFFDELIPPELVDNLIFESEIINIPQPKTSSPAYTGEPGGNTWNLMDYAILTYDRVLKQIAIEYL